MTHTVRTTRWPDRDIEVDDAEYTDLQRWGQIIPAAEPERPAEAEPVEVSGPEARPDLDANPSASESRRRRGQDERRPATPVPPA